MGQKVSRSQGSPSQQQPGPLSFKAAESNLTQIEERHLSAPYTEVWLQKNALTKLPLLLAGWSQSCQAMYLNENDLEDCNALGSLRQIQELNLSGNRRLGRDMTVLSNLTEVTMLYLNDLPLLQSADFLGRLTKLKVLQMNNTAIQTLPESVSNLTLLRQASLTDNRALESLPEGVTAWGKLEKLFLHRCGLKSLPGDLSSMTSLTKLYMNGNPHLKCIPLLPSSIDELYFAECDISAIPDELPARLTDLKFIMGASNARLQRLPQGLIAGKFLEILHFSDCALSDLGGPTFGPKVAFIHLSNNKITDLPGGFEGLEMLKLRKFELDGNPIAETHAVQVQVVVDRLIVNQR